MATGTVKYNISNKVPLGEKNQKTVRYYGTITFSAAADTYATGGLLPLAGFAPKTLGPFGDRTPVSFYVESATGSGWWYVFNTSTGKLQIFGGGAGANAAASELAAGQALTTEFADTVIFEAVFPIATP